MAKISRQFTIDSARSVAATGVMPSIEVSQEDGYCFQTVFSDMESGASGTLTLQTSLDNANFSDYPSSGQNFTDASTNLMWEVTTKRHRYARLVLSAVTTGTGTATTTFYGETFTE
jgi:hypothetical protein